MKPRIVQLFFEPGRDIGIDTRLAMLEWLLTDQVELPPVALGWPLPEVEAVVIPQLLGEAFRRLADFKALRLPILIMISQFGTLSMWDWEIIAYLFSEGVEVLAPYKLAQTRKTLSALLFQRRLQSAKFLVYRDNSVEGTPASILKRLHWSEDACTQRMNEQFGVTIEKRSFSELGARRKTISDTNAERTWKDRLVPIADIGGRPLLSTEKLWLVVKRN